LVVNSEKQKEKKKKKKKKAGDLPGRRWQKGGDEGGRGEQQWLWDGRTLPGERAK